MPFNIGPGELILLAIVALLFFGPKKLPELGKAIGESLGAFKRAMRDAAEVATSDDPNPRDPAQQMPTAPTTTVSTSTLPGNAASSATVTPTSAQAQIAPTTTASEGTTVPAPSPLPSSESQQGH